MERTKPIIHLIRDKAQVNIVFQQLDHVILQDLTNIVIEYLDDYVTMTHMAGVGWKNITITGNKYIRALINYSEIFEPQQHFNLHVSISSKGISYQNCALDYDKNYIMFAQWIPTNMCLGTIQLRPNNHYEFLEFISCLDKTHIFVSGTRVLTGGPGQLHDHGKIYVSDEIVNDFIYELNMVCKFASESAILNN